jgi:hypothetical protein
MVSFINVRAAQVDRQELRGSKQSFHPAEEIEGQPPLQNRIAVA